MYLEPLTYGEDDDDDRVNWVVPGLFPDGVIILEGRGGLGKSSVLSDLAAAITVGRTFPYRKRQRELLPGAVLVFAAEERKKQVRKRLRIAGGDGGKAFWTSKASFYGELDALEAEIKRRKARLVIVDPVQDFLGVNTRDPESTRWMLTQLDFICEKYGCCIVLIRHMRKDSNDQDPMEDGGLGTGQLRNFVRAVFRIIIDPDDDTRRLLMATKFNYGPFPETLVFQWKNPKSMDSPLVWDEKPGRWNAFNLLSRPKDEILRIQGRECDKWMKRYFRENNYRVPAKDCLRVGGNLGFNARTIQRTRVRLNIVNQRLGWGQGAQWMWTHPFYNPEKETDTDILSALSAVPDDEDDS